MYRIGIDLGGTNIAAGIVNEAYEIICQESVPTGADRSSEAIADDMAALCRSVCVKAGIPETEIASVVDLMIQDLRRFWAGEPLKFLVKE